MFRVKFLTFSRMNHLAKLDLWVLKVVRLSPNTLKKIDKAECRFQVQNCNFLYAADSARQRRREKRRTCLFLCKNTKTDKLFVLIARYLDSTRIL